MALPKPAWPILQRGNPINTGLVLGLPVYEGSGLTVHDISGRGNNGTFHGGTPDGSGVTWQSGPSGWSLGFNGSTGYVQTSFTPKSWTGITMSAWVNYPLSTGFYPMVLSYGANSDSCPELRFMSGNGTPEMVNRANNAGASSARNLIGTGWHLLYGTSDGATLALYIDGELDVVSATATSIAGSVPLRVGARSNGEAVAGYFPGILDNPRIWNRALSPADVRKDCADSFAWCRARRRVLRAAAVAGGGLLMRRRRFVS